MDVKETPVLREAPAERYRAISQPISEESDGGSEAEDLLLKAIRSLPQHEQDEVMRSIVGRAFAGPGTPPGSWIGLFPQQGIRTSPSPPGRRSTRRSR